MSHQFKRPAPADVRRRRERKAIKKMAAQVNDQATLDRLVKDAPPGLCRALIDRLKPHLPFTPLEPEL